MRHTATSLAGLYLVESDLHRDERGQFERVFCQETLRRLLPGLVAMQANLSTTLGRGSLRGLHFQWPPAQEAKLVRCIQGRVFDVAVDLRAGSETFLQWHGVELAANSGQALLIPQGFAHGFQVLDSQAQLLYFHGTAWSPDSEGGVRYDDPALGIRWPLPMGTVSQRDLSHALLSRDFKGVVS